MTWRSMLFAAAAISSCDAIASNVPTSHPTHASSFFRSGGGGGVPRKRRSRTGRAYGPPAIDCARPGGTFVVVPSRRGNILGGISAGGGAIGRGAVDTATMSPSSFDDIRVVSTTNLWNGGTGPRRTRHDDDDDGHESDDNDILLPPAKEEGGGEKEEGKDDERTTIGLSELDAIRILRSSSSSGSSRRMVEGGGGRRGGKETRVGGTRYRYCDTAFDVLNILDRASSSYHVDDDDDVVNVERILDRISPNVAAAALRRLCSSPFLPHSSTWPSRGGDRHRWGWEGPRDDDDDDDDDASTKERHVYEKLMQHLLAKVGYSVMEDRQRRAIVPPPSSSSNPGIIGDGMTTSLNWYALADLSYSLSKLADVLGGDHRDGGRLDDNTSIIVAHLLTSISPREQGTILDLFEGVIECMSRNDESTSSFVRCIGPRRLVRDVLRPLAIVEVARGRICGRRDDGWDDERRLAPTASSRCDYYDRLIAMTSSYLALPHSLERLTGLEISIALWSMTKIYNPPRASNVSLVPIPDDRLSLTLQSPQGVLMRAYMKRLRKYAIRSSTTGRDMTRALWSVARLVVYFEGRVDTSSRAVDCSPSFEQLIPLTTRLPGEDESESSYSFESPMGISDDVGEISISQKAIIPARRMKQTNNVRESNDSPDDALKVVLRDEAVIMFHTLVNEIVNPPAYHTSTSGKVAGEDDGNYKTRLESLSLWQISEMLQAATILRVSHDEITPAIIKILKHLTSSSWRNPIRRCRSCKDISRILLSLQRLRVGTGIFDDANDGGNDVGGGRIDIACGTVDGSYIDKNYSSADVDVARLECRCVQLLGEKFLDLVIRHIEQSKWACDPRTLATIVRSGVMMFQGPSIATKSMLDAATILILKNASKRNVDAGWNYPSFLSRCNEFEASNCLFAFATAKHFDQGVFNALTDHMMEDDIVFSCTPSSASRSMWSVSMLLSLQDAGSSGNTYKLIDLFHQLSPLLLSSSLSPTDISNAMWAMAKSEYVIDKGIFDHLAKCMASDEMLRQSNTKLISRALWSCGKMVEYEDPKSMGKIHERSDVDENYDNLPNIPPYVKSALKYVQFLSENRDQVSPKQISQSIWAIGRLRISDRILIEAMGEIASCLHASLNAREIATTIWGLSKVEYDNTEVISKVVRRIMAPHITEECTAQEASMLLFALGKLQICEEEALVLFSSLSMILKRQLNDATSQSILNALWAFEVAGIAPPPELLSTWAQDRLGMNVSTHLK